jgi:hypothetical protein
MDSCIALSLKRMALCTIGDGLLRRRALAHSLRIMLKKVEKVEKLRNLLTINK